MKACITIITFCSSFMSKEKGVILLELMSLLKPMGKITYLIVDEALILEKDDVTFGKIQDDRIYLLDHLKTFKEVEQSILKTPDAFFMQATKSYWNAKK